VLDIKASASTPSIVWDEGTRTLSMTGESYPENSFSFYAPVFEWLNGALETLPVFRFQVRISYMNSSSTKCMLDILDILCDAAERGCDVRVTWFYDADNDRALDLAEEFREDIEVPFEIVPVGGRQE
jgi:hypothetical protein